MKSLIGTKWNYVKHDKHLAYIFKTGLFFTFSLFRFKIVHNLMKLYRRNEVEFSKALQKYFRNFRNKVILTEI